MSESPVASIHIPLPLRPFTDGADEVTVSGDTVGEALAALGHEHPAMLAQLFDAGGRLRSEMDLYLRGINITAQEGLETPLRPEDVLVILTRVGEQAA